MKMWIDTWNWQRHLYAFDPARPWLNAFTRFRRGAR